MVKDENGIYLPNIGEMGWGEEVNENFRKLSKSTKDISDINTEIQSIRNTMNYLNTKIEQNSSAIEGLTDSIETINNNIMTLNENLIDSISSLYQFINDYVPNRALKSDTSDVSEISNTALKTKGILTINEKQYNGSNDLTVHAIENIENLTITDNAKTWTFNGENPISVKITDVNHSNLADSVKYNLTLNNKVYNGSKPLSMTVVEDIKPLYINGQAYDGSQSMSVNFRQDFTDLATNTDIQELVNKIEKNKTDISTNKISIDQNKQTINSIDQRVKNLEGLPQFEIVFVTELPSSGEVHKLYLVPKTVNGVQDNSYDEYIWTNSNFELVGDTEARLTNFYTKTESDEKFTYTLTETDDAITLNGNEKSQTISHNKVIVNLRDFKKNYLTTTSKDGVTTLGYDNQIYLTDKDGELKANNVISDLEGNADTSTEYMLNFVNNEDDLNTMLNTKPLTLKNVFDEWYKFSHSSKGQFNMSNANEDASGNALTDMNGWQFDESKMRIANNVNTSTFCGFISQKKYDDFYFGILVNGPDEEFENLFGTAGYLKDDDMFMLVCAFMKDKNGVEHTISLVRSAVGHFRLHYDYGNTTNVVLVNGDNQITEIHKGWSESKNTDEGWYNRKAHLSVERYKTKLTCRSSEMSSDTMTATIEYTMPSEQGDLTLEAYENIKYMLSNKCQMGVGSCSQNGFFYLEGMRNIVDITDIYDSLNDQIYIYSSGWLLTNRKVSEEVKDNARIYNSVLEQEYVYKDGQGILIAQSPNSIKNSIIDEVFNGLVADGKENEVLSVKYNVNTSKNEIGLNPILTFANILVTQEELDAQLLNSVGMKTIFDTWYRFSHWRDEQNLTDSSSGHLMPDNRYSGEEHALTRSLWSYDANTKMIRSNRNSPTYSGFISPNKFSNWYLKIQAFGGGDGDNDGILIVCAFTKDSNGKEHTISLIRARSGIGNGVYLDDRVGMEFYYSLVYDYRQDTQKELANNPSVEESPTPIPQYGWNNNYCCMSAKRTKTNIKCYTSDVVESAITEVLESSLIDFTLPSSKPSDWSEEMWNNMNAMLGSSSQVGVGVHSQNGLFTILEQKYIFEDLKVYDMVHDEVLEFNEKNNIWTKNGKASKVLGEGKLYFNRNTNKLFYYENGNMETLNS